MGLFRKRADRTESDVSGLSDQLDQSDQLDPSGAGPEIRAGAGPADADGMAAAGSDDPTTAIAWSAPAGSPEPPLLARPAGEPLPADPSGDPAAPTELVAPIDAPVEIVPVNLARPEPALHATGLGVGADGQWVFAGVEILVRRATVAAVVGPQGSGRSSLLLAVTGRLAITAGTAAVAGVLVTTDAPAVRALTAVARLGDLVVLEPTLTVAESVDERSLIDGVTPAAGRVRFAEAARVLGLAVPDYLLVRDLTQEEATLLAVAVTCVRPSDLIVLDDLDRGLNGPAQHRVIKALSRLALVGPAILVSTTDGWPVRPVVAAMVTLPPRDRTPLLRPVQTVVVVPAVGPDGLPLAVPAVGADGLPLAVPAVGADGLPLAVGPDGVPAAVDPPSADGPAAVDPRQAPGAVAAPAAFPAAGAGPILADPVWAPRPAPTTGRHAARPAFPADPPVPAAGSRPARDDGPPDHRAPADRAPDDRAPEDRAGSTGAGDRSDDSKDPR